MIDSNTTVRAWKDESFRLTLSDDVRAVLPDSPTGTIEITDAELGEVTGGNAGITDTTICGTSLPCITVITIAASKNMSCGACDSTIWSGSCAVSSLGCCPET